MNYLNDPANETMMNATTMTNNSEPFDPANLFTANVNWHDIWQSIVTSLLAFSGRLVTALVVLLIGWLVIVLILQPIVRRIVKRRHYDDTVASFVELSFGAFLKAMLVISVIDVLGI